MAILWRALCAFALACTIITAPAAAAQKTRAAISAEIAATFVPNAQLRAIAVGNVLQDISDSFSNSLTDAGAAGGFATLDIAGHLSTSVMPAFSGSCTSVAGSSVLTCAGITTLAVASTPISGSCSSGQVLYNNAGLLGCTNTSTNIVYPQTVSGTVTSGGLAYFASTTQMASSGLLAANSVLLGGGAGAAPYTTTTGTGVVAALGNAVTGTGGMVLQTSPTLTTPNLGVASATSVNKVIFTPPATSGTVAFGTDGAVVTFQGTDTYVGRATTDTLTHKTFDTAGLGNSLKLGGSPVTAIQGSTSVLATVSVSNPISNGHCVSADGSGNLVDAGGACTTGGGGGTVSSATGGLMASYATTGTTVSGNANATFSGGDFTLGQAGSVAGTLSFSGGTSGTTKVQGQAAASGTLSLPAATDTLVGRATTDTLTNKTIDTATSTVKLAGTTITGKTSTAGSIVATASGSVSSTTNCGTWDGSGNITAGTGACGTVTSVGITTPAGGLLTAGSAVTGSGSVALSTTGTSGGVPYFFDGNTLKTSGALGAGQVVLGGGAGVAPSTSANASISLGALTLGQAGSITGRLVLSGPTSGTTSLLPAAAATGTLSLPAVASTDTLVGRDTTDTLTNKTINLTSGNTASVGGTTVTGKQGASGVLAMATGSFVSGNCVKTDPTGNLVDVGSTCGSSGGTVTSVGLTAPSGSGTIFAATGSPVTASGNLGLTVAGTSGGIPYFSSGSILATSTAGTAGTPMLWGGAGVAPTAGTKTGNTSAFATASGSVATSSNCATWDGAGNLTAAASGCGSSSATVSSVGLSVPGGSVFGVTGSPVTGAGTLGITATGTQGGLLYMATGSTIANTGALTSGMPVLGGGGSAPTTGTISGNTTKLASVSGTIGASTNCTAFDGSGNVTPASGTCITSASSGAITSTMMGVGSVNLAGSAISGTLPSGNVGPAGSPTQLQFNNSSVLGGAAGITYTPASGITASVIAQNAADVALVVKGASSQSAHLQDWRTSAGVIVASVDVAGAISGSGASITALDAGNVSAGTLNAARLPSPFTNGAASGNTSTFATVNSSTANGHCAQWDVSGNIVDAGASCFGGGGPPTGSAGGDLGGTYPNPDVLQIKGAPLGLTTATSGNVLVGSGTAWVTRTMGGDCAMGSTGTVTCTKTNGSSFSPSATTDTTVATNITTGTLPAAQLPNTAVTPGSYGNGSTVATFTVDAHGRLTAAGSTGIGISSAAVSGLATSATTDTTNAANISSGLLPAARLPSTAVAAGSYGSPSSVGTFSVGADGRLTAAGSSAIAIASGAVSGLAASATTDTTNASNIGSGTLNTARLPSPFTSGTKHGSTADFATVTGTPASGNCAKWDASGNLSDQGTACSGASNDMWIDAKAEYGVACDLDPTTGSKVGGGTATDDTTAIQNALNAAATGPRRIVILPPGNCKVTYQSGISAALAWDAHGVQLWGQGMGTKVASASTVNHQVVVGVGTAIHAAYCSNHTGTWTVDNAQDVIRIGTLSGTANASRGMGMRDLAVLTNCTVQDTGGTPVNNGKIYPILSAGALVHKGNTDRAQFKNLSLEFGYNGFFADGVKGDYNTYIDGGYFGNNYWNGFLAANSLGCDATHAGPLGVFISNIEFATNGNAGQRIECGVITSLNNQGLANAYGLQLIPPNNALIGGGTGLYNSVNDAWDTSSYDGVLIQTQGSGATLSNVVFTNLWSSNNGQNIGGGYWTSTSAAQIAMGVNIYAPSGGTVKNVKLLNPFLNYNQGHGLYIGTGSYIQVQGGHVSDNGRYATGTYDGINIQNGVTHVQINGTQINAAFDSTTFLGRQRYGVNAVSGVDYLTVTGVDTSTGNGSGAPSVSCTATTGNAGAYVQCSGATHTQIGLNQ